MKPQPDALYLFLCPLEWRDGQNPNAYKELVAALDDQDADIRQVAESLLHLAAGSFARHAIKPACRKSWSCIAVVMITEPVCCRKLETLQR